MNNAHVLDELSAYIDGEAAHPERIARHLQHCTECAQRHMALLRLSAHVQALPAPPENPDLLGRVLAEVGRVRAADEARPTVTPFASRWSVRAGLTVAAAAALLLAGGLTWRSFDTVETPVPVAQGVTEPPYLQDDAVVSQLAALLDQGVDMALFEPVDAEVEEEVVGTIPESGAALEALLVALAETAQPEPVNGDGDEDVFGDVELLDGQEAVAFQALLATYLNEG